MKIAILASGHGTNARAIFQKIKSGELENTEVCLLASDHSDAPALDIAREFGSTALFLDPMRPGARFTPESEQLYINTLGKSGADLIVLAGFMRILSPNFIAAFKNRIINLHPSLLPSFKGKDAIKQAFDFGVKVCGCSVHFVSEELDGGKIIAQKVVEINPLWNLDELEQKVHEAEHILLPETIGNIAAGKIAIG